MLIASTKIWKTIGLTVSQHVDYTHFHRMLSHLWKWRRVRKTVLRSAKIFFCFSRFRSVWSFNAFNRFRLKEKNEFHFLAKVNEPQSIASSMFVHKQLLVAVFQRSASIQTRRTTHKGIFSSSVFIPCNRRDGEMRMHKNRVAKTSIRISLT